MNEDDPIGRLRIIIISLVILMFFSIGFADAMKPVTVNEVIGAKCIVKKVVKSENVISGYFKPSVRSGYSYKWHYKSWINHCPYCGHHLSINPKGVPESELTCKKCSADFDGVTGYVKNGLFNKRLTRA